MFSYSVTLNEGSELKLAVCPGLPDYFRANQKLKDVIEGIIQIPV